MKHWVILFLTIFAVGLAGCTSDEDTASKDVTFKGSMNPPPTSALQGLTNTMMASVDPTDYKLYCVTFTEEPTSGTGDFDAEGFFSITIADAAGLPVGCFINLAADNSTVATLTFVVADTNALSDGTSSSTALEGGIHEIVIQFDPVAGTASADIIDLVAQQGVDVEATFSPADLAFEWTMACDSNDESFNDCKTSMEASSFPVFLHVITAKVSGEQVYAAGAWKSKADFVASGATEGIAPLLPAEVTELKSLNTDPANASPQGAFTGFMAAAVAASRWDYDTNSMSAAGIQTVLNGLGVQYDPTHNDKWVNGGNDWCPNDAGSVAISTMNLTLADDRQCFLSFIDSLNDNATIAGLNFPRVESSNWHSFTVGHHDQDGNYVAGGHNENDTIDFRRTSVGSPDIRARYALMNLEMLGNTAVMSDFWEESWEQWDDANSTSIPCVRSGETVITIIPIDADRMTGWFTTAENTNCGNNVSSKHGNFKMQFTK